MCACRWMDARKGRKEGRGPGLERLRCSPEDGDPVTPPPTGVGCRAAVCVTRTLPRGRLLKRSSVATRPVRVEMGVETIPR